MTVLLWNDTLGIGNGECSRRLTDERMNLALLRKWLTPGIGIKRWLLMLLGGLAILSVCLAIALYKLLPPQRLTAFESLGWLELILAVLVGIAAIIFAFTRLANTFLNPYRRLRHGHLIDLVYTHSKRGKGARVVAIGGGTGLPSVLRSLKALTSNITAVVTVADDGGSSGRLRRELGVLPPGDLRNNIAALADDESLMTQLFQYRFSQGDLGGHAFGNLFISALAGVTGSLESALVEIERVLNIQGRVLPATLEDVQLVASVRLPGAQEPLTIRGESRISQAGGVIEQIALDPADARAFSGSVEAILNADIVVLGPGSLFTSILPNVMVKGINEALRGTSAYKVYICNIATQPGETDNFTVADHVLALERHIGRGVFQMVLANNAYPTENAGENTRYVQPAPPHHEIFQRYEVRYLDLVDAERPWRHDPYKLAQAIIQLRQGEFGGSAERVLTTEA